MSYHFAGPDYGFSDDIMGTSGSSKIGYDHYLAYYNLAKATWYQPNNTFVNSRIIDLDYKADLIQPTQQQIDEQE